MKVFEKLENNVKWIILLKIMKILGVKLIGMEIFDNELNINLYIKWILLFWI